MAGSYPFEIEREAIKLVATQRDDVTARLRDRNTHVNDLESCYVRALDAMGKVQKLRDAASHTPGFLDRERVIAELDGILAAFQGK